MIDEKTFEVTQKYQILHIADWCNECGNCSTFCPTSEAPYKNKPHLLSNRKSFDSVKQGYYYESLRSKFFFKYKNASHSFSNQADDKYHYSELVIHLSF